MFPYFSTSIASPSVLFLFVSVPALLRESPALLVWFMTGLLHSGDLYSTNAPVTASRGWVCITDGGFLILSINAELIKNRGSSFACSVTLSPITDY
jgi:hypothetical protein